MRAIIANISCEKARKAFKYFVVSLVVAFMSLKAIQIIRDTLRGRGRESHMNFCCKNSYLNPFGSKSLVQSKIKVARSVTYYSNRTIEKIGIHLL